jgi:hypothetical protein
MIYTQNSHLFCLWLYRPSLIASLQNTKANICFRLGVNNRAQSTFQLKNGQIILLLYYFLGGIHPVELLILLLHLLEANQKSIRASKQMEDVFTRA